MPAMFTRAPTLIQEIPPPQSTLVFQRFQPYLQNLIDQVKEERKEKELLNQR